MSVLKRSTSWVCLVCGLMLLAWPVEADAQRGRAVRRPRPSPVSHTRVRYGPRYRFYNPYFYGPYHYGSYYGAVGPYPFYGSYYRERGSVRLQVKPEQTEVYVDGYYAGVVDSYDGVFQRLHLPPGEHDIELRLEGHRSIQEQVYLPVGSTYRIRHEMEPLGPGETTPPPPTPPAEPPADATAPLRPGPGPGGAAPPALAPVNGFGTLAIRVQPADAVIFVDGEEWRSPDRSRLELELGVGRHRVEVQRDGYEGYVTDVDVRAGDTTAVNISLPRDQENR